MMPSERFVGGYVEPDVKQALRNESSKTGKTMSRILEEALREKLLAEKQPEPEAA